MIDLPPRSGPRPRTTRTNPHQQLDQHPPAEVIEELLRHLMTLPHVVERASAVSVPGARALWLPPEHAQGPPEAFMIATEFAHVHPLPDGSLHVALPPEVAEVAMARSWAEQHPVARQGWIPANVCMVYAPRDQAEMETVLELVRAAHRYACGVSARRAGAEAGPEAS